MSSDGLGTSAALSELIQAIYACVLEPDLWSDALALVSETIHCRLCAINVLDPDGSSTSMIRFHGATIEAMSTFQAEFAAEAAAFFNQILKNPNVDLDGPYAVSRLMPREQYENLRVYREWARPQGYIDVMSSFVLTTRYEIGTFDAMRHIDDGPITDADIATLRLIAPHLRRAVTISDLIDQERARSNTIAAMLDALSLGAIIVGREGQVLHANVTAEGMLARRKHVQMVRGRLTTTTREAAKRLRELIDAAAQRPQSMTAASTGALLGSSEGPMAIAHVLPIMFGQTMRIAHPQAIAVVFIAGQELPATAAIEAVAENYGLTAGERRVLAVVADGTSVPDAAQRLQLAEATARTHMKRIFAKVGVVRHAELVALIRRLSAPLRQPDR